MPHIFDLFTQAESVARPRGGLGIGLSVVKETAALHGGTVQATSDGLGTGSEFTVRVRLAAHYEHWNRHVDGFKAGDRGRCHVAWKGPKRANATARDI